MTTAVQSAFQLSLDDLALLSTAGLSRSLSKEQLLFEPDDIAFACYLVSSGELEVFDRNQQRLRVLTAGQVFGELAILSADRKRTAGVRALTDCLLVELPANLDDLLAHAGDELLGCRILRLILAQILTILADLETIVFSLGPHAVVRVAQVGGRALAEATEVLRSLKASGYWNRGGTITALTERKLIPRSELESTMILVFSGSVHQQISVMGGTAKVELPTPTLVGAKSLMIRELSPETVYDLAALSEYCTIDISGLITNQKRWLPPAPWNFRTLSALVTVVAHRVAAMQLAIDNREPSSQLGRNRVQ